MCYLLSGSKQNRFKFAVERWEPFQGLITRQGSHWWLCNEKRCALLICLSHSSHEMEIEYAYYPFHLSGAHISIEDTDQIHDLSIKETDPIHGRSLQMYVYVQGENGVGMAGSAFTRKGCPKTKALKSDRTPRIGTSPKYPFLHVACMFFAQIS